MLSRHFGADGDPFGADREWQRALGEPEVDWVTQLSRYMISEPTDWSGWDRRFVHEGSYVPVLGQDTLRLLVGVDTSGSISDDMLRCFLQELMGILSVTESVSVDLYFTDSKVYGPYRLTAQSDVSDLTLKGGGGTNFRPLFERAQEMVRISRASLARACQGTHRAPSAIERRGICDIEVGRT